jgi:hypothetical protein
MSSVDGVNPEATLVTGPHAVCSNRGGIIMDRDTRPTGGRTVKSTRSRSVTKPAQPIYDAVVALTDAFCRDHLNDE